jgi:hypothetical protein
MLLVCGFAGGRPSGLLFALGPPRFPGTALRFVSGPRCGRPFLRRAFRRPPCGRPLRVRRAVSSAASAPCVVLCLGSSKSTAASGGALLGKGSGTSSEGACFELAGWRSGWWGRGCGPFLGRAPKAYQEPDRPLKRRWLLVGWALGVAACPAGQNPDAGCACPTEERTTPPGGSLAEELVARQRSMQETPSLARYLPSPCSTPDSRIRFPWILLPSSWNPPHKHASYVGGFT